MMRRNRSKHKVVSIGLIIAAAVFYNEYLAYEIQKYHWSLRDCSNCVKILLVADPQILGEEHENYVSSWLARWDSDRYLEKTFSRAVERTQPHVIAFLGDLMDEGQIADVRTFQKYKRRFDDIFSTPDRIMSFYVEQKIYLPGDNDIGGEDDSVSSNIHDRFNFAYSQADTLTYETVTFFKVNALTQSMPDAPKDAFLNDYTERNTTNVVLSHMPLLFVPGSFVQNVIKELSPQVIFTAHEHKAMHISLDTATDQLSEIWLLPPYESTLYQLRLDMGDIHELQVPTCSYRMGTPYMGYGLAYIGTPEKTVEFTVLWLPGRFRQLWAYLLVVMVIVVYAACTLATNCYTGYLTSYSRVPVV